MESDVFKRELCMRENLLRQFFNSKYHKLRVIFFYFKRFLYITVFADFKNKFREKLTINKVLKEQSGKKNAPRILYDFQTFSAQKAGGISRLFSELVNILYKDKDLNPELALRYSENYYLKNSRIVTTNKIYSMAPPIRHMSELIPPAPFLENSFAVNLVRRVLLKLLGLKYLGTPGVSLNSLKPSDYYAYYDVNVESAIRRMKKGNFDVFHPTYYDTYFLKYLNGKPFVLTVFDMIHEKFFGHVFKNDIISRQKKILVKKASRIIAISEQTKKDLMEILKVPESKITVIPLASSFKGNLKTVRKPNVKDIPKKYILFVGTRVAYKNFYFMIKSIARLLKKERDLYVLCVGEKPASGPFTKKEKDLFEKLKISKKVLYRRADDEDLHYLYSKALMFIFPTLYEGFGIPILEAFSCGCPVVCSDINVLREVGKDAVVYFDPKDGVSMQSAVKKLLNDKKLREELTKKGKIINSDYSWSKTVEMTKEVYFDIIKKNETT
ncbi:MAG: glycosyltransferase family 4 protein [Patescibacteria group bacterium]